MNEQKILLYFKDQKHRLQGTHDTFAATNASCGDEVSLQLSLQDDKIEKATFTASACSVTVAAAEYLCRTIENMQVKTMPMEQLKRELLEEFQLNKNEKRVSCALLPYQALEVVLQEI